MGFSQNNNEQEHRITDTTLGCEKLLSELFLLEVTVTLTFGQVIQQEMCLSETQCPLLRRIEIKFLFIIWQVKIPSRARLRVKG